MNITYPEKIDLQDRSLLEKATRLLEGTMTRTSSGGPAINTTGDYPRFGGEGSDIRAIWTAEVENSCQLYRLTVSDPLAEVSVNAVFSPSDLQDRGLPRRLPYRMARLWGDYLEKRSHEELRKAIITRKE